MKTPINKKRHCHYCKLNLPMVDYKDATTLRRFMSSFLKIAPKRRTGLCSLHQRKVSNAVKQARIAGFLAYVPK